MRILALDLGGTRLKAGLVVDGVVETTLTVETPADGSPASIERAVLGAARELGAYERVGLSVPGLVDRGVVVSLPGKHAGIEGIDLQALLGEVLGAPTWVTNDAIAYAMGEAVGGAGRGAHRVVVVTIGTGVGVTVIQGGAPATDGIVGAGILGGFIPISERTEGPTDSIGRCDTIEALCAAPRIAEACGVDSVEAAYAAGHSEGLQTYRRDLVRALVALASAHAPDVLVLGGGPMTSDNPITPGIEDIVNQRLFGTYRVEVRLAELGDAAALVGLAHLVEAS